MHRLNEPSGGNDLLTQSLAWLAAFAAALGLSLEEVIYFVFGGLGFIISLGSFICGRWDARRLRQEEAKRTQLLARYVAEAKTSPAAQRLAQVKTLTEVLNKTNRDEK